MFKKKIIERTHHKKMGLLSQETHLRMYSVIFTILLLGSTTLYGCSHCLWFLFYVC